MKSASIARLRDSHGLAFGDTNYTLDCMKDVGFTFWQDGPLWVGYLDEFPDYETQGESLKDLKAHLSDLHRDLNSGIIPNIRRHSKLTVK